jgi:selenocysteine-specific elongation factor
LIDVHFRLLPTATNAMEHNQRIDFFCGATETPAIVRLLGVEQLAPGAEGWLQLRLERPVVVTAGDGFILRQPSPSETLGGGVVVSPHPRRRWRRFDQAVLTRLATLAHGAPEDILLQTLTRQPFLTGAALIAASGLELSTGQESLADLRQRGAIVAIEAAGDELWITLERWSEMQTQLRTLLQAYHQAAPLRRGMSRGEMRSRWQAGLANGELSVRLFNALVERSKSEGIVAAADDQLWLAGHTVQLTLHQQAMIDHLLEQFDHSPTAPPSQSESLRLLGDNGELLEYLLEQGLLMRIGGEILFRPASFAAMVAQIEHYADAHGSITLAQARDLLQTSRKYAQAILEELDARRITRREGDLRLLRR